MGIPRKTVGIRADQFLKTCERFSTNSTMRAAMPEVYALMQFIEPHRSKFDPKGKVFTQLCDLYIAQRNAFDARAGLARFLSK